MPVCPLHWGWPMWLWARLPVAPASCSLGEGGGWEPRGGVLVAVSRLRHQALNWDLLSSSPGGFQLSLPLYGRGQGLLEGE